MQVISVERWTFWLAVLLCVAGIAVDAVIGPIYNFTTGLEYSFGPPLFTAGLLVFLVSVALGGWCDPSVRRFPGQPSD